MHGTSSANTHRASTSGHSSCSQEHLHTLHAALAQHSSTGPACPNSLGHSFVGTGGRVTDGRPATRVQVATAGTSCCCQAGHDRVGCWQRTGCCGGYLLLAPCASSTRDLGGTDPQLSRAARAMTSHTQMLVFFAALLDREAAGMQGSS